VFKSCLVTTGQSARIEISITLFFDCNFQVRSILRVVFELTTLEVIVDPDEIGYFTHGFQPISEIGDFEIATRRVRKFEVTSQNPRHPKK